MTSYSRERWQRLEPLLNEALDLDVSALAQWLQQLHATSPELAAEIEALLSREGRADHVGFLATPLRHDLGAARPALQLGAWSLERPIGQGGMGSVWLARRNDGRYEGVAAVKLLNLALLTPSGQARFRREGSVLARLSHPGVARLLDAGVSDAGQPYLVLEHIQGERLDAWATERQLSRVARVRLLLQVLAAVSHAHANLVVHRDIKPSNILVTADGTAKLLDFGISTLLEDGDDRDAPLTGDGGRLLTPEYAAPEQARGERATTATDVYACGVLLYRLLSGRHPTAEGRASPTAVLRALLEVEPPRLGLGDLDHVLAMALRKEPSQRYQTAAAFAEDLERALRHEPVRAKRDALGYRARLFVRRNRAAVAVAAVSALALVVASATALRQAREAARQRDLALRSAERSRAMADLQGVLAGNTRAPEGGALSYRARIALAEEVLARQYRAEPWLVADVMTDLAARFYETFDLASERAMLARALAVAERAGLDEQAVRARCARIYSYAFEDLVDSAQADLRVVRGALRRLGRAVPPELAASCLAAEGKLMAAVNRPDSAINLLQRAAPLVANVRTGTFRLEINNDLGEVLRLAGRTREAVPYQRRVVAELDSAGFAMTEQMPSALSFLASSLWDLGEWRAAEVALAPYVRRFEQAYGAGHVSSYLAWQYGESKLRAESFDSADVWLARAMADTSEGLARFASRLPALLVQLHLEQERFMDARQLLPSVTTSSRGRRANAALLRARLMRVAGDTVGAIAHVVSELGGIVHDGQVQYSSFAYPLVHAGEWRLERGDVGGADSLATAAWLLASRDSLGVRQSVFGGRSALLRARVLARRGAREEARRVADDAVTALTAGYGPGNRWVRAARGLADSLAGPRAP